MYTPVNLSLTIKMRFEEGVLTKLWREKLFALDFDCFGAKMYTFLDNF